jgi:hypothetical protein
MGDGDGDRDGPIRAVSRTRGGPIRALSPTDGALTRDVSLTDDDLGLVAGVNLLEAVENGTEEDAVDAWVLAQAPEPPSFCIGAEVCASVEAALDSRVVSKAGKPAKPIKPQ